MRTRVLPQMLLGCGLEFVGLMELKNDVKVEERRRMNDDDDACMPSKK